MTPPGDASQPARVLIKEKIGESGVQLLRAAVSRHLGLVTVQENRPAAQPLRQAS